MVTRLMADLSHVLSIRWPIWRMHCVHQRCNVDSLRYFMLMMAGLYLASLVALFHVGLRPAVPWGLAFVVPILFLPFAMIFFYYSRQHLHYMLDMAAGVWILVMYNVLFIWPIIALGLLVSTKIRTIRYEWRLLFDGLVTTVLGYAVLWNLNYLLARFVPTVHDPVLRAVDEWIYSLFLTSVSYTEFFPVVRNDFMVLLFNNAYMVLFPEVILVLLLVCQTGDAGRVFRFLKGLFALYAIGVLCFMIYPAIGPCLYYPGSFDPMRANTQIVQGMLHDYHAAIDGEPLLGYGYFIAVPSLHVMVAVYLQQCLVSFSGLYRVFFPVNAMLIGSTVILGYHYIVDVLIATLIMGILGIWMILQKRFRI